MRSPNEAPAKNSSFRYAPLKVLGKRKQIILRIEFTQNFGLDCTFGSKYVNRTVIHSIYCTNYVLPVIGLILKFKKAVDINKMIKDYEATPFTLR